MGKRKKLERAAAQASTDAEREVAQQAAAQRAKRNRAILIALPLVTAALAAIVYFAVEDRRAAAFVGVVGFAFWMLGLLGSVGGAITPRDRTRAGSIDFGRRD